MNTSTMTTACMGAIMNTSITNTSIITTANTDAITIIITITTTCSHSSC